VGSVLVAIPHRTPLGFSSLLVFVLVALTCAAITWRHPAVGIAGLLTCEPFDWAHDLGPTQITLGKVALLGVMLGLAARRTSLAPLRAQRVRPIVLGALAIGVVTALTAIPAIYIDATARETLKAIEYLAVFAVAAIAIRDERDETLVVNALGALTMVVCGLALAQLTHAAGSGIIIAGRTIPRIAGPLEGPNQLAGYLDLVTVVFLAYAIVRRDAFSRVVLAIAFATDVLTLSRAGLLGVVAGGAIVFFARGDARVSRRFTAGAGALVAALALLAIRFGFAARFFSTNEVRRENGLGTRAELWTAALTLWRRDPALGIGAGNFELQLPAAGLIGVRTHANSLYLQSLAEGGIALFSAVVWTFVSAIALALRDARRSVYLLGFAGAASAFAIHQLGDFLTFFPKVGTLWAALLGLAVARIAALRSVDAGPA
jgi:O-antigen ligase